MVDAPVPPNPQGTKHARRPARALRRLSKRWRREADRPLVRHDRPLDALLLSGLTLAADEGPAVDVLIAINETLEGMLRTAGDAPMVHVPVGELTLLARRVEVATELARRGAPVFYP